jgi:FkbM family methyltransferase
MSELRDVVPVRQSRAPLPAAAGRTTTAGKPARDTTRGGAGHKPALLLLGSDRLAGVGEDITSRAVLEGRSRGLFTHLIDRPRFLAETLVQRTLADDYSVVELSDDMELSGTALAQVGGRNYFDVVFGVGADTEPVAAGMAAAFGAPGNDPAAVRRLRDKDLCRAALASAGFPQPASRVCADAPAAEDFLRQSRGPWIVKSRRAADARGVSKVSGPAELAAAVARLPRADGFLVEEFVDGREHSVEGLFIDGRPQVLAVVEKQFDEALGYREIGHVLPAALPARQTADIERTVAAALRALGLVFGIFHVELWLTDEGIVLGAIHVRPGGDWIHVLLAHMMPGLELFGLVYDDALGRPLRSLPPRVRAAAVRFVTAPPGRLLLVKDWHRILEHPAVLRAELSAETGEVIGTPFGADDRAAAIVVGAETAEAASALAADLAAVVRFVVEPQRPTDEPPLLSRPRRLSADPAGDDAPVPYRRRPRRRRSPSGGPRPELAASPSVTARGADMDTLLEAKTASPDASTPERRTHHLALIAASTEADMAAIAAAIAARPAPDSGDEPIRRYLASAADATRWAALIADGTKVARVDFRGAAGGNDIARPVTLMFPGLGDHYLDMGRGLYREFPVFRRHVDHCSELLRDTLGLDLRTVIFSDGPAAERPADGIDLRRLLGRDRDTSAPEHNDLNRPSVAQPALFVIEYALAQLWLTWGVRPAMLVGYSLGEYVAACLAGVLNLADSLTLVARRAQLVETLPTGAMLAVLMAEDELTPLLGDGLSLAAINGPEFCVVAGPARPIAELAALLAGRGVITNRVQSTHAFHTPWMAPIADQVTALVAGFELQPPRIPYVSNVTGRLITDAEAVDPVYWSRHLCHTVRFTDAFGALPATGVLLETGPGQTLSSLAAPACPDAAIVTSMRHSLEHRSDTAALLTAAGRLWLAGADLDWQRLPTEAITVDAGTAVAPAAGREAEPTITEAQLIAVWERLLKVSALTPAAHFFDLGGNSMLAARLILRVARAFDVELTLRQLYEHTTVAAMAAVIDAERSGGPAPAPIIAAGGTGADAVTPRYRLPNGMLIAQQNEAETKHFYEDIFDHRTYAKHGITVPAGATVVDVGGNIGLFTLFAHYEARDVRVFTFEPAPPLFEKLSRNVADHRVQATLFNYGLADREDSATFTFYPRSSGMSSFHPDEQEEKHNLRTIIANQQAGGADPIGDYADDLIDVRFEAVTFDTRLRPLSAVIAEQGIEVIDLMKVDVQKSEMQVIEGIADEDWPRIRQLVLEAHDAGDRVATLVRLLESRGFAVHAEQDELYVGTDIYNIYATRSES